MLRAIDYEKLNMGVPGAAGEQFPPHPAFARFKAHGAHADRVLLIKAPAGTGRRWFARSWIGGRPGELHDWSGSEAGESIRPDRLAERLAADGALHAVIILGSSASHRALEERFPCSVAEPRDLLLSIAEIQQLLDRPPDRLPDSGLSPLRDRAWAGSGPVPAEWIHGLCGGWLAAVRALAADPANHEPAQQVIRIGLATWLQPNACAAELAESAFLPEFTTESVEAYYAEFSPAGHVLGELVGEGIVAADGHGGWMMPTLVRRTLKERARLSGPERTAILEAAAVNAIAATQGMERAVDSAVQQRFWPALQNLLLDRWVDMFISHPGNLASAAAKIPRVIAEQSGWMWVGLRYLNAAGADGMVLPFPAIEPDYANDRTAQRLHRSTEAMYRKPNARALSMGVLEIAHLRLNGMYAESGEAATQLRKALDLALDTQRLSPTMAAFVELQAGISLHLAGRIAEAQRAYGSSFHWAKVSGKPFLLADVTGKLALANALAGNGAGVEAWLERHGEAIGEVGWGKKMVERSADLARAFQALNCLDFELADAVLDKLPQAPDNDEFWAVHAHLLAVRKIHAGIPEAGRALIRDLRQERVHAAAAPLASGLLNDALQLAGILDPWSMWLVREAKPGAGALTAMCHLLAGEPDEALQVLERDAGDPELPRRNRLSMYLNLAARNPGEPTPQVLQKVARLHRDSGGLFEVAMLLVLQPWAGARNRLGLDTAELRRLESSRAFDLQQPGNRPRLTGREQEILRQLRAGMTRRQIAVAEFRSENTVKTQLRSLYRKLEASDLHQALENARVWGF